MASPLRLGGLRHAKVNAERRGDLLGEVAFHRAAGGGQARQMNGGGRPYAFDR
jgi:hypothetical protein